MDYTQAIMFLCIIIFSTAKAIAIKPCANMFPANHTTFAFCLFLFVFLTLSLPIHYNTFIYELTNNTIYIAIAILKGASFYAYFTYSQKLTKHSASSRAFVPVIAVGLIAFVNFFIFSEAISSAQLITVILITMLGIAYYFYGHLSETQSQKTFITLLCLAVLLSVIDHIALSNIHWFTYLYVSIFITMIFSIFLNRKNIPVIMRNMTHKKMLIAGTMYMAFEVIITQTRVTILPVTITNVAALMSTPITMITMAYIYNESTMKKQAYFGGAVFLISIGILLN